LQNGDDPDYSGGLQAGLLMEDWFAKQEASADAASDSVNFKVVAYRPVPISFIEELGQEDFWKYIVPAWGAEALKVYPLTEGRLMQQFQGEYQASKRLDAPRDKPAWVLSARNMKLSETASPNQVRALELTKQRMSRAVKIVGRINFRKRGERVEKDKNKPWNIRIQHIKKQQDIADIATGRCQEHVGKVES
jgi:hypothetical protein